MRSSMGLRPANPSSVPCQWVMECSPSFQQSSMIRPSTSQGKSSRPMSRSLTCTPMESISARASLRPLFGFGALGLAPRDGHHVDESATVQEDAVIGGLHFGLDFFHQLLAVDGGAQKRLEHGEQRLGFVESEGAVGHCGYFHFNAIGEQKLRAS